MASPGNDRQGAAKEAKDNDAAESPPNRQQEAQGTNYATKIERLRPLVMVTSGLLRRNFVLQSLRRMIAHSGCHITNLRIIHPNIRLATRELSMHRPFTRFLRRFQKKYPDSTKIPKVTAENILPEAGGPFAYLLHGTPMANVRSIIARGMDPAKIRHGSSFYFSTDPEACRRHTDDSVDGKFNVLLFVTSAQPSPDPVEQNAWTIPAVECDSLLLVAIVQLSDKEPARTAPKVKHIRICQK